MKRRKIVGLALGSGAARGLTHIGVLRVLHQENIPIDMIAGTSMGAIVDRVYALERNMKRIEETSDGIDRKCLFSMVDLVFSKTELIDGKRILAWGRSLIDRDIQFDDLQIPLACVATDIRGSC
jgi:NTE family protein